MSLNHSPKIVTDGLVLCLDAADPKSYNGSGTTWYDRSGNGNNGTLTNVTFEDNSFYFNAGLLSDCQGTVIYGDSYSVELFFKLKTLNTERNSGTIIASSPTANVLYPIWISNENGQLKIRAYQPNTTTFSTSNTTLVTDTWYHVILTATRNATFSLYINGELDSSGSSGSQPANDYYTLGDLRPNRNLDMDGNISIFRLYNREVSYEENLQNYNAIKSRFQL